MPSKKDILSKEEMQAVEEVLINGGSKADKETLEKMYDLLAGARYELRCDNHKLHRLYSMQKNKAIKQKEE